MNQFFKAWVVRFSNNKSFTRAIEIRNIDDLPKGEVLIRVHYSSLNYKDGLSCIGNPGVTRHYPHTPGIDAAGIVESCSTSEFKKGDPVVVISCDLGMNTPGGFGQFIRVPAKWVMNLPKGISLRESMIYGTAGFTAGLSVYKLQQQGIKPQNGSIVVTGATGGVGCISISILAKLGYNVFGSTGKADSNVFLNKIGIYKVIDREDVNDVSGRPLLKESWAGAIDTIGGNTLVSLLKACKKNGSVIATGNVGSQNLPASVLPFILRGVNLLGINSQGTSIFFRKEIWSKLANEWKTNNLDTIASERTFEQLNPEIDKILTGNQIGRILINMK